MVRFIIPRWEDQMSLCILYLQRVISRVHNLCFYIMNSWSYAFFKSGEDSAVVIRITSLCTLLAIGTFCRNALHTLFQIPFGVLKVRTLGFNPPPCYPEYISKREQWWSWNKEEDSSAWEQMWWPAYQSFIFFDGRFFTWAVFKILVLSSVFKFTLLTTAIQSSPEDGSRELFKQTH